MKIIEAIKNNDIRKKARHIYYSSIIVLFAMCIVTDVNVKEGEEYEDFDHIVTYIYEYDDLPSNYTPKNLSYLIEGEDLFIYGYFGNFEELLPLGEQYTEVYINATKENPGEERLVYTTGIVYYTSDHYESFYTVTQTGVAWEHLVFVVLLYADIIGGISLIVVLIRKYEYISLEMIKEDIKEDYIGVKNMLLKLSNNSKNDNDDESSISI